MSHWSYADVTFGIKCCWKNKGGAGEWQRSTPADLTGGSTVHFCQNDNQLVFLSARSKQDLENIMRSTLRLGLCSIYMISLPPIIVWCGTFWSTRRPHQLIASNLP